MMVLRTQHFNRHFAMLADCSLLAYRDKQEAWLRLSHTSCGVSFPPVPAERQLLSGRSGLR
jgi:hypothetical protein